MVEEICERGKSWVQDERLNDISICIFVRSQLYRYRRYAEDPTPATSLCRIFLESSLLVVLHSMRSPKGRTYR